MDVQETMMSYIKDCVDLETVRDTEADPVFIGALAAVVFYTDSWRFHESQHREGKSLADSVGIAITDTFVTQVLAEHAEEDEGDFESFRRKYPPPTFV